MPLLDVTQLSVSYPGVRAVDQVSFSIEPGEIFALVGGSGSGKSSVALALAKLLPPSAVVSGQVRLGPLDLLRATEEQLRAVRGGKIAYVFQDPATSLNPVLTIGEQLLEAITLHTPARGGEAVTLAKEWLRRVGLAALETRLSAYPHELSGGQRQRVMLAMALSAQPDLLVADEPTTALDVTVQLQLLRLLRDLQRSLKLSILLISHDLLVVERIAHRVGVMSQGQLVEVGPVAQVLRQPQHAATAELLRARDALAFPSNG